MLHIFANFTHLFAFTTVFPAIWWQSKCEGEAWVMEPLSGWQRHMLCMWVGETARFKITGKFRSEFRFRAVFRDLGSRSGRNQNFRIRFSPVFFKWRILKGAVLHDPPTVNRA
jgi:hypothetical protein